MLPPIPISDMVIAGSDTVVEAEASPVLMAIAVEVGLGWSGVAVDCIGIITNSATNHIIAISRDKYLTLINHGSA